MEASTQFGARLKLLREEKNLTQEQLGKELGCIKQTISNYEKGDREPSFTDLLRMANFFNVTTDYLLGRTNQR